MEIPGAPETAILDNEALETATPDQLNAAIHKVLTVRGWGKTLRHTPTHPWATNLMAAMSLLMWDIDTAYVYPFTATLTLEACRYTCRLEGDSPTGWWYCEATHASLPRAICMAWLQGSEEEQAAFTTYVEPPMETLEEVLTRLRAEGKLEAPTPEDT